MTNTVSKIISDETLNRMIQIESAGRPYAKAATSSALGLGQFINSTWLATVRKHRPDWFSGRTESEVLAKRYDPVCSIEMLARFSEDNAAIMGPGWTDGDLYLAHFAGAGTARMLLRANPQADCSSVFGAKQIAANRSILQGKTCEQVRTWAAKRMAVCGGRNWIAVYLSGAKPAVPKVVKNTTAAATVVTGGVVATGAVTAASSSHAGPWLTVLAATVVIALAIVLIWYRRMRQEAPVATAAVEEGDADGLG